MTDDDLDEDGKPGWRDKDEHLDSVRELRRDMRAAMKAGMGFRLRVTRPELDKHLRARVAFYEAGLAKAKEAAVPDPRTAEFRQHVNAVGMLTTRRDTFQFFAARLRLTPGRAPVLPPLGLAQAP